MTTKLLITNLPPDYDASMLEDMFTIVGDVQSSEVEKNAVTGNSACIGRVEMSSIQQAQDCIDHFNGQNKGGSRIGVKFDQPHVPILNISKRAVRKSVMKKAKTFVANRI